MKFANYVFYFFGISVYIRLILEAFFTIWISILSGFKNYDPKVKDTPSFITCLFLILCVFLFVRYNILLIWKASYIIEEEEESRYAEFFRGMKPNTKSRLNSTFFLCQRIVSIILLVGFSFMPSRAKASLLFLIQAGYIAYLLVVRPFEKIKDHIIECFNQITFLFLVFFLLIFSEKRMWSKPLENVFMSILFVSPMIWLVISIGISSFALVISIRKWRKRKQEQIETRNSQQPENVNFNF